MADIFSKSKRSHIMASIKSKNTKPEILIRKALFKLGLRYSFNNQRYIGSPDIFLRKYQTAIFVHGCFWHGHDCKKGNLPKSNFHFWQQKISKNIVRDSQTRIQLEALKLNVIEVWQCEVSSKRKLDQRIDFLVDQIKSQSAKLPVKPNI